MAEQSTITLSGLPQALDDISATDGQYDALVQVAEEFNKQVPISKISTETALTAWTPTFTGFSVAPTVVARYVQIGKIVHIIMYTTVDGTSNTTAFTMTLPVSALDGQISYAKIPFDGTDNGAGVTGMAVIGSATRLDFYTTANLGTWTASGNKSANIVFFYEAA